MSRSDVGDDHKEHFAGEVALKAGGAHNMMNQFSISYFSRSAEICSLRKVKSSSADSSSALIRYKPPAEQARGFVGVLVAQLPVDRRPGVLKDGPHLYLGPHVGKAPELGQCQPFGRVGQDEMGGSGSISSLTTRELVSSIIIASRR